MSFTIPPSAPVVNSLSYEAVILDRRTVSAISPDHIGEAIRQLAYDMDVALRSGSASARAVALDLLQYEADNQSLVGILDKGMDEKMAMKAKTSRGIADKPAKPAPPPPTHTPACVECGATFRHTPGQRYCSRACSRTHWRRQHLEKSSAERVVVAPRPCVECAIVFTPDNNIQTICSRECRLKRRRSHERRRTVAAREIAEVAIGTAAMAIGTAEVASGARSSCQCGSPFVSAYSRKTTCSEEDV